LRGLFTPTDGEEESDPTEKADELDDDGLGEERKGPTMPVDELDDVLRIVSSEDTSAGFGPALETCRVPDLPALFLVDVAFSLMPIKV